MLEPAAAASSAIKINRMTEKSFKNSYETRGQELPETPRGGGIGGDTRFAYGLLDTKSTQKRADESLKRLKTTVQKEINAEAWANANAELRNQLQTLRYDLDNLAQEKGLKRGSNIGLFRKLDQLDFEVRSKRLSQANKALTEVTAQMEDTLKALRA